MPLEDGKSSMRTETISFLATTELIPTGYLAVSDFIDLPLAELPQHLQIQAIIIEYLFHRQSSYVFACKDKKVSETKADD